MDAVEGPGYTNLVNDLENQKRFIRDREDQHAQELEGTRNHYRQEIDLLKEAQNADIAKISDDARRHAETQHKSYKQDVDRILNDTQDNIEHLEQDQYDRTGRLVRQHETELAHERGRAQSMDSLNKESQHKLSNQRQETDQKLRHIQDNFERDRQALTDEVSEKLDNERIASKEALARTVKDSRDRIDKNIRDNHAEMSKQKMSDNLRFERLAEQSKADRDMLKANSDLREHQLTDERTFDELRAGKNSQKTLGEYRDRMNQTLAQTVNDHNFESSIKDQENASRIARQEAEHKKNEQTLRSQFRMAENNLKYQNDIEKDQNQAREALNERRHQQDVFLNSEAIRKNNEISNATMKARYSNNLHDLNENYQNNLQTRVNEDQKKMTDLSKRNEIEHLNDQYSKTFELSQQSRKFDQQRNNLIHQYEARHNELDDLRKRQTEDLKNHYQNELVETKQDVDHKVERINRHAQAENFVNRERFKRAVNEYEQNKQDQHDEMDNNFQRHSRRLTDNFNRVLVKQQQHFDEHTDELQTNALMNATRMREDADFTRRAQLLDLQNKNRLMISGYETKINELVDENHFKIDQAKSEHDKETREAMKKTKEMLESAQKNHEREIAIKDQQMNEKLRLQREAFQEQIERLRRSHEFAIKKS